MKNALALAFGVIIAATTASADFAGHIGLKEDGDANLIVTFDTVTAKSNGIVVIYDYKLGESGPVLGTGNVHAGVNSNLRINAGRNFIGSVYAVQFDADGHRVDQRHVNGR